VLLRTAPIGLAALLLAAYLVVPRYVTAPEASQLYRAIELPAQQAERGASAPARITFGEFAPAGPLVADLGFRPAPDGFSFQNYASNFPEEPGTLTVASARQLFGDAVCAAVLYDGSCVPSPLAEQWLAQMNTFLNSGRCEGLAALSQALFLERLELEQLEPSAASAYDLSRQDPQVSEMVSAYAVTQFLEPVASATAASRSKTPAEILDALVDGLQPGADPPTLGLYDPEFGGHAVTPFAIEDRGGGVFRVWVYDNNFPGSAKYVEIDRAANTWRYSMAALNPNHDPAPWAGDAQSFTLDLTPASVREAQLVCPFCQSQEQRQQTGRQLVVTGAMQLLAVDGEGRRIGYVGGRFVNEIPGAHRAMWRSAGGTDHGAVFTLPPGLELTVTLTGRSEAATGPGERFAIFSSGGALTLSGLDLERGQQETIELAGDGAVTYETGGEERPRIELALGAQEAQYAFTLEGLSLQPGAALALDADVLSGELLIAGEGIDTSYQLAVARVDDRGARLIADQSVQLGDGFAQVVAFRDAPGSVVETVALADLALPVEEASPAQ
jgi:hypothetical protein